MNFNKKSILIVTPLLPPEPGGPSYYSVALKDALEKKGNTVSLIAFRDVRKYPSGIRHLIFLYKILFKARHADALIILDTVSVALPAVIAGWILGKKMVVRVGGDFVWERYIERTNEKTLLSEFYTRKYDLTKKERILMWLQKNVVCSLAHHIVFNTEWQRNLWEKPYALKKEKTSVIQNAFTKSGKKNSGGNTFLSVWRPTAFKNSSTLKEAYTLAQKSNTEIELAMFENIPREELYAHMEHARALIIPSLTELSPNMALEALSMGLPVLLTKDCGASDILDTFVTWIDPKNPNDIALNMLRLMNENEYTKAKEKTVSFSFSHTYEEIAEEFLCILETLHERS